MSSFARASFLLVGAAAAGFLVWLATQFDRESPGGYWAVLGILAGAGLVLALSRIGPRAGAARRAPVLIAFLCALVAAGWVALAVQPHGNWFRNHVASWSGDIGIRGLIDDLGLYVSVLAFGIGTLFGFVLEAVSPARGGVRQRPAVVEEKPPPRESAPQGEVPAEEEEPAPAERERALAGSREDGR